MTTKDHARQYLSRQGLSYQPIDLDRYIENFQREMDQGLAGEKSDMAMYPTYIHGYSEVPKNKKTIVMDAGGTNLRTALVSFNDNGSPTVENFSKTSMPGIMEEVSREDFYSTLVDQFADFADQADRIGFCFSYPAEITPDHDAIPKYFTKEIKAPEVLGLSIRNNLRKTLADRGLRSDHHLVVVNDTVSTFLTAINARPFHHYSAYIGFILGTGINGCYLEHNSRIPKVESTNEGEQIINTECGSFHRFPRGVADRIFDDTTKSPGRYLLEKASAGAYFGPMCEQVLKRAAMDEFFSPSVNQDFMDLEWLETKYADMFLHNPNNEKNPLFQVVHRGTDEDREKLYWLIDGLLERAAKLIAGTLTALVLRNPGGESPLYPVCLNVDGTTFYAYHRFQHRVEHYLDILLTQKYKRYYEIIRVDDASLLGAAIAALTHV